MADTERDLEQEARPTVELRQNPDGTWPTLERVPLGCRVRWVYASCVGATSTRIPEAVPPARELSPELLDRSLISRIESKAEPEAEPARPEQERRQPTTSKPADAQLGLWRAERSGT